MIRQNPLTEWRGATELFLSPIRVNSAEGSMPWHGDLRAETGIFYRRTGGFDKRTGVEWQRRVSALWA